MSNIVLIGMAGCGKSTVGKILSEKLQKEFVDTDEMIEKAEGRPVPEIVERFGEDFFRYTENMAVNIAGKGTNRVIATGGLGEIIAKEVGCINKIDRMLTLEGLRLVYEMNKERV